MSGSHEACYRFLLDITGLEEDEIIVIVDAIGIDNALTQLKKLGYDTAKILSYTVC